MPLNLMKFCGVLKCALLFALLWKTEMKSREDAVSLPKHFTQVLKNRQAIKTGPHVPSQKTESFAYKWLFNMMN